MDGLCLRRSLRRTSTNLNIEQHIIGGRARSKILSSQGDMALEETPVMSLVMQRNLPFLLANAKSQGNER
jgi:hypothetical protein